MKLETTDVYSKVLKHVAVRMLREDEEFLSSPGAPIPMDGLCSVLLQRCRYIPIRYAELRRTFSDFTDFRQELSLRSSFSPLNINRRTAKTVMHNIDPILEYIKGGNTPYSLMHTVRPLKSLEPESIHEFFAHYLQKVEQGSGSTSLIKDFSTFNIISSLVTYKQHNILSQVVTDQDSMYSHCYSGTLLLRRLESLLTNSSLAQASVEQLTALLVVLFFTIVSMQTCEYGLSLINTWRQQSMMDARRHLHRILGHYARLLLDIMQPSIPKSDRKPFFVWFRSILESQPPLALPMIQCSTPCHDTYNIHH